MFIIPCVQIDNFPNLTQTNQVINLSIKYVI